MEFNYPDARRDNSVVDDYYGVKVADPYRWMENFETEECKEFVEAQNFLTSSYLESCKSREKFHKRLTELWDHPKYYCAVKRGSQYFYFMNDGLQSQNVMYVQDGLQGKPRVFLDPNKFSDDSSISISMTSFSEDDKYFAYGIHEKGSDWTKFRIRNMLTSEELTDVISDIKMTEIGWTHDNLGFFYSRFPGPAERSSLESKLDEHHKLFYHKLGTPQSMDILCIEFPDRPSCMIGAMVSHCGKYLVVEIRENINKNMVYYCDLSSLKNGITGKLPIVPIVEKYEALYDYVTNEGTIFTFRTDKDSPNFSLVNTDISQRESRQWSTLVPQHPRDVLDWVACVNYDKLIICYVRDVKHILQLHSLKTGEKLSEFPLEVGTITGFSGRKTDNEVFFKFLSFLTPGIIYHCDVSKSNTEVFKPNVFKEIKLPDFEKNMFCVTQEFYSSKDGTKIPMYIMHAKYPVRDGSAPTILYGYGGFNFSILPVFSVSRIIFMKNLGGIVAIANIRGGGEYGRAWHDAGRAANKQNSFDDFRAAAEYLIDKKYTSPRRLIINGLSNGGMLVGVCINQMPELIQCAIGQVGALDILRYHKFTVSTPWKLELGCSDNEEEFHNLYSYSPLHNVKVPKIKGVQYPAVLLLTADHDDRVIPAHSLKLIAELQHTVGSSELQTNPLMVRVEIDSGHIFGKSTSKCIQEITDIYCFIMNSLDLEYKD